MQPFRLRKDAREWFKDIRSPDGFKLDFDVFYFCFIAGIAKKSKLPVTNEHTAELVATFPGQYSARGKLLVALFLVRELETLGVTMDEKKDVHSSIARLVDPGAPHSLSDDGVKNFNQYAHGGFDVLLDWFAGDRPRSLETFLRMFKKKLDGELMPTV
jgi:hypothetical protein